MIVRRTSLAALAAAVALSTAAAAQDRPYLGIYGEDGGTGGGPSGSVVREVLAGSPAEQAGLRPGDLVVRVGERAIHTFDDLANLVRATRPGEKLEFTLLRNGAEQKVPVTIGTIPPQDPFATDPNALRLRVPTPAGAPRPMIGIISQPLDESLRRRLGAGDRQGVVVAEVDPDGPAAKGGVLAGDLILDADGRPFSEPRAFSEFILSRKPGDVVALKILRGGKEIERKVTVETMTGVGVPAGVIEGPLNVIRNQQIDELQRQNRDLEAQVRELKSQVRDLESKLEKANASASAPKASPAKPEPPKKSEPAKPAAKTKN